MARAEEGDFQGAISAFSSAIAGGYRSWVNRGLAHEHLGNTNDAESDYRTELEENPDDLDALVNLGTLLITDDKPDVAVTYLERAARLDRTAHWQLADAYIDLDRETDALESLNTAIAAGVEKAYLDRAVLTADTAPAEQVIADFERGLASGAFWARREFVIHLDTHGDQQRALAVAEEGIALGDESCAAPLAVILQSLDRTDEALAFYRRAVAFGDIGYAEDVAEIETRAT